ncbi:efflux RND transporter periplasmic adaptor subunit [Alistipes senegalensis]|uniref:efflux RND transporter periplasmic adaptor subunit n=1 Tax=Alistipes senegalensis TaxID=1288121 RepID=UPI002432B6E9|nr:efflux RND transporter periplasmic adaptor subunit [Alistipes senegalensis]MCI7306854.1 efflux RND transporter periplasmic adaptor subunit [Alistipes senegalensis]MDD7039800.1 efflux RND transporter periplasmic adaptor subunit [Alistipes senegalensis]MDY2877032.1 efflux RND transporter periplasmic adaptor subunit [Alistipes senegalensis]
MKISRDKIRQQALLTGRRTLELGKEAGGRVRRFSKRTWIILGGAAVVAAGGLWWWLRPEPAKPVWPVVEVEPVQTDDIELYGEYVGRIRAQQFVEIRARVEGFLEKMMFEEGTYVRKGQPLFIIDPKLYRAHANKARAQLNKDKAMALKAERDLQRIRPLYEQNAASQLDLDNAIASYESATAAVAMSEADLTQTETALSYTTVSSPISGYISERSVDIGTLVGPNGKSLLATVVKSDTVRVDFSMTGLDYLKSRARNVNLGQKDSTRKWDPYITITLADNTQYPLRGLVDFADPQVDPETGTFSVRAEMANPDRILLPGQITKVRLLLDVREDATVVPTKSVVIEKGGAYVFVIRPDSIAERRMIELGPEVDNRVIVERGVVPGEKIVVEGFHKLTHGDKVDPVPAPAKSRVIETEASEK